MAMTQEQRQQLRKRIGLRISDLRQEAGMTQEQLALKAGLQRSHVARIEAGRYDVPLWVVQSLAEALTMTVDII